MEMDNPEIESSTSFPTIITCMTNDLCASYSTVVLYIRVWANLVKNITLKAASQYCLGSIG